MAFFRLYTDANGTSQMEELDLASTPDLTTLHEATKIGDRSAEDWPNPYLAGRDQAWRLADREKEI